MLPSFLSYSKLRFDGDTISLRLEMQKLLSEFAEAQKCEIRGKESTDREHTFVEKDAGGDEPSVGKKVGDAQVALKASHTGPMCIKIPAATTRTSYTKSTCNRDGSTDIVCKPPNLPASTDRPSAQAARFTTTSTTRATTAGSFNNHSNVPTAPSLINVALLLCTNVK
ncbi:Uncharacterized protein Fot_42416 [Forsythia ovata]|uniref:Uncharacterized protein n=1 Tax=Forsythia ovata TaxID=205694 RepID=A0ABD1RL44_9LAMI